MTGASLRVLFVEDDPDDVFLISRQLTRDGLVFESQQVDSASSLDAALHDSTWDVVISDYNLPGFGGMAALQMIRERDLDVPFVLVSGVVGEESAAAAIRAGAQDFVSKSNLERVARVVRRELAAAIELRATNDDLQREIERRKEAESQLRLRQRLEAIGQLAAGVAHEINTPVQFVLSNLHFLKKALTMSPDSAIQGDPAAMGPEMALAIEESIDGIERVAEIVRSLGEFSHTRDAGFAAVDLNALVQSTVALTRNEWKYVAEMELALDPDGAVVRGQQGALGQALLNIIVNAAHAIAQHQREEPQATPSPGRIRVETRSDAEDVTITIEDSGPGIAESIREKIFEPFFTTKDVGKGTGQGLALAFACVTKTHQGQLTVESAPGKGARFVLVLPKAGPQSQTASDEP